MHSRTQPDGGTISLHNCPGHLEHVRRRRFGSNIDGTFKSAYQALDKLILATSKIDQNIKEPIVLHTSVRRQRVIVGN